MIIQLSIVDKHRPAGNRHRGSILIEISEVVTDSHFDIATLVVAPEMEAVARRYLCKLMNKEECEAMDLAVAMEKGL